MAEHLPLPPLARLHELLLYNPDTGVLTWRARNGRVAGCRKGYRGYTAITIDKKKYKAHRICYYMGTGIDPGQCQIDHYPDNNPSNNRLNNLRLALDTADNLSTKRQRGTRRIVLASPDGLLLQCASIASAARTLGCATSTLLDRLSTGTPTRDGWRAYNYPRTLPIR